MPQLIVIFGPPAVGKMSVGKALCDLTGYRLLYNHMTIDLVSPFFDFGTPPFKRLVTNFRTQILEEISNSDLPGVVFTVVWDFDSEDDNKNIPAYFNSFAQKGLPIHFVELTASLKERLVRNRHPDRLAAKPTKRDIERSEFLLLENEKYARTNSNGDFPFSNQYLCIDTTHVEPDKAARQIADFFSL